MKKGKWNLFEVTLKLYNGNIVTFISSMIGHDIEAAKKAAINNDWEDKVLEVLNVKFPSN